jgi:drug/metabolite transporter (DMT)-like permease
MSEAVLSPSPAQRLALPALILGGLAIGSSPIFVRLSEVGPVTTAVWRVALALPIFAAGLAVAIGGVVVLKGGGFGDGALAGDGLAALAAVFYGGYILAVGRLRDRFSVATIMLWTSAVAAAATLMEPVFLPSSLYGWAVLLGLSWVSQVAGQSLITYALAWLPAAFSSLTLLIQPVAAAALAWIVLAEPLGPLQGLGGALVLAGILLARRA